MGKLKEQMERENEIKFDTVVSMQERLYEISKEVEEMKLAMLHLENSIMREENENITSDIKRVNDVIDIIEGRIK